MPDQKETEPSDNQRRLQVMRGEAERRQKTWRVMGLSDIGAPLSQNANPTTLLVLSRGANDGRINRSRPHGIQTIQAFPGRPLRDALAPSGATIPFGAVIIDSDVRDAADQVADIRRHPGLADWPILALFDVSSTAQALRQAGATRVVASQDLLTALSEVPLLIEETAMRRSLSEVLKALRTEDVEDSGLGLRLIGRKVFEHHLTRLLMDGSDGDISALPLSLLVVEMIRPTDTDKDRDRDRDRDKVDKNPADRNPANQGPGEMGAMRTALMRTACSLVSQLVRGEDLPAKWSNHQIVISMPGTSADQAQLAAERLQAIFSSSQIAPSESRQPPHFTLSVITSTGAESADDFLARALK